MCQLANRFKIAARILFNCNCFFSFLISEKEIEKAVDDKKRILDESGELQEVFEKLSTEYSETKKYFINMSVIVNGKRILQLHLK